MKKITVGDYLSICRSVKGVSLREVEKKTGVSSALLHQIETSKVKNPSFRTICRLCKYYGITLDKFIKSVYED